MTDYQHVCPWWLAFTFDNPLRKLFHKPEKLFSEVVRPGMAVADIGCGMGYFSLGLASLVAPTGRVVSVDLQPQMLAMVEKRARKAGVSAMIRTHQCSATQIGLEGTEPLDFILAFWMVHETPDHAALFRQLGRCLKTSGQILVAEPRFHVSRDQFDREIATALQTGLQVVGHPTVAFSHAALLAPLRG